MKELIGAFGLLSIPVIIVLGIMGIIGGFLFPYSINSWLVFFGKEPVMVFWQGFILGIIPYTGKISIPFAVVTFVLMMFLV